MSMKEKIKKYHADKKKKTETKTTSVPSKTEWDDDKWWNSYSNVYGGNYTYSIKDCHKGLKKVFTWGDMTFYGGGFRNESTEIRKSKGLIIDLDGNFGSEIITHNLHEESKRLLSDFAQRKIIRIDWRDYSHPDLKLDFWTALIKALYVEMQNGVKEVIICCYGGHGRTGTCLAILAGLLGQTTDPVKFVREKMCDECIESASQLDYIQEITGYDTSKYDGAKTYGRNIPSTQGNLSYYPNNSGSRGVKEVKSVSDFDKLDLYGKDKDVEELYIDGVYYYRGTDF